MVVDQGTAMANADKADAGLFDQLIQVFLIVFVQCVGGLVQKGKFGVAQSRAAA